MKKTHLAALIAAPVVIGALILSVAAAPFDDQRQESVISADAAEELVLKELSLEREQVRFDRPELERERGRTVWDVELHYRGREHSFEVDARAGEILKEKRRENGKPAEESSAVSEPAATELTREQAIRLALEDAGLNANEVRELEAERGRERGVAVYEIEFEHGRTEYEYEIRVDNGKIVEKNVEIDD